ncbi:MAG: hypothetical protein IPI65_13990 [Bacteroidetes bacterium]|nr:hypothetical protein [Bacteroidota bacterium]
MDVNWTPDGPIPDAAADVPKAAIFAPWTDWHSGLCTNCIYHEVVGVAPNRKLIVSYDDVPLFSCTGFLGSFQIVLYETSNKIENHLTHVDVCPGWDLGIATQGILNEDGTQGMLLWAEMQPTGRQMMKVGYGCQVQLPGMKLQPAL